MKKDLVARLKPYYFTIGIFLFFLIVYSLTMFPGVGGRINYGDSAKWQYLHLVNGLPHSTGYPQFLLLTELFSRIIFFLELPERITFISVFFGALAMAVFYNVVNLLTKNRIGSAIATCFIGFTYTFWSQATEAEVYTLNIFYLLSIFYLFIKFYYTKQNKYFLIGCAVYALSFGHHLTMITILPGIAFIALVTDYKKVFEPKNILLIIGFVCVGVLQYAFIYYRAHTSDPAFTEVQFKPSFEQFYGYITGSTYHNQMLAYSFWDVVYDRFNNLFILLNINFTVIGLILAFAGFFYFWYQKKEYIVLTFLTLCMAGQLYFNIGYNVGDLIVFFIPVYIILGIFIGLIFSSRRFLFPAALISVLTIVIIFINIKRTDILAANTFATIEYQPYVSLYSEHSPTVPMLYTTDSYFHNKYMEYTNLTSAGNVFFPRFTTVFPDSFYVARDYDFTPELAEQYDLQIASKENAYEFLKKRIKPNLAVFISFMDEGSVSLPREFMALLREHGSKVDSIAYRGSYAAILYNNKIADMENSQGPVDLRSNEIENNPLPSGISYHIHSSGYEFGNNSIIKINGFDYSLKQRGVNFVVYDTSKKKVVDIISFDTYLGEEKKLYKAVKKPQVL